MQFRNVQIGSHQIKFKMPIKSGLSGNTYATSRGLNLNLTHINCVGFRFRSPSLLHFLLNCWDKVTLCD